VLDGEAPALGVAGQRTVEVGRPQSCLVPPDALPDLDDDVLAVSRVGLHERHLQLLLERRQPLLQLGHELTQIGVLQRVVEIRSGLSPTPAELVRAFELFQLAACARGLTMVVVDGRVGHALLRLVIRAFELVEQRFQVAGHRRSRLVAWLVSLVDAWVASTKRCKDAGSARAFLPGRD